MRLYSNVIQSKSNKEKVPGCFDEVIFLGEGRDGGLGEAWPQHFSAYFPPYWFLNIKGSTGNCVCMWWQNLLLTLINFLDQITDPSKAFSGYFETHVFPPLTQRDKLHISGSYHYF